MAQEKKQVRQGIRDAIEIPQGVSVSVANGVITVTGKSAAAESRALRTATVQAAIEGSSLVFTAPRDTKRERKLIGSLKAHIRNIFRGVTQGHVYKLKICSGHFPMSVAVNKNEFSVKNFLGEKIPRTLVLSGNVKVKVEGDHIIVESSSKESAGQTAAAIEAITRRAAYDKRIFQDGIYIIDKDGKGI
ncbi:50S ribosomal protein L6 [Candidatus Woesearchaeota archaeon]|nr:50S ribosomal protein L6 [Candidatus Woesearchaeota archaeon]